MAKVTVLDNSNVKRLRRFTSENLKMSGRSEVTGFSGVSLIEKNNFYKLTDKFMSTFF